MNRLFSVIFISPERNFYALDAVSMNLGNLGEWIRVSENNWFLWTHHNSITIAESLRNIVGLNNQYIVTRVTPQAAQGVATPWIWEWLNDKMQQEFHDHS